MPAEARARTSSVRYEDSTEESRKLEKRYLKPEYGAAILALERGRMERSWIKAGQDLRRGLKSVDSAIMEKLRSFNLKGQTRLTRSQIAEVMEIATVEMRRATLWAMEGLTESLNISLRRGVRAANALFESRGVPALSSEEMLEVMRAAADKTAQPWPPRNPSTYDKRLIKASQKHLNQLKRTLGKRYQEGKIEEGVVRNVYRGLRKLGPSPIVGGSYANKLQMILASEESRITNAVTLEAYRKRDVEFAYWRLSPAHPWYGGGEVCEWLASVPYGGSTESLRDAGLDIIDRVGLYSMSDWPDYPHPFCKCYPEPVIL